MEVPSREAVLRERAQYHIRNWLKAGKLRGEELVNLCLKANLIPAGLSLPHLAMSHWIEDLIEQGLVKKIVINRREFWIELEQR